jgi:2-dehydro-3-deoxyphosphooctonate aldolase (KDO 8-P synthase)
MKPLILIAGPCVIESYDTCAKVAEELVNLQGRHGDNFHCIFKSSIDKANRTSISSYRGLGWENGFDIMRRVASEFKLPITTDFHTCEQVEQYGRYFDVIQIPALLCRQTDLISSAAMVGMLWDGKCEITNTIVNVKKGQFLKPQDVASIIEKARASRPGCEVWITERGVSFGYGRMIVDFTGFDTMRQYADKVICDCTHSNNGKRSDGITLARCAIAAGADGIFVECHPQPDQAKCDGPNSLHLASLGPLIDSIIAIGTALSEVP